MVGLTIFRRAHKASCHSSSCNELLGKFDKYAVSLALLQNENWFRMLTGVELSSYRLGNDAETDIDGAAPSCLRKAVTFYAIMQDYPQGDDVSYFTVLKL